MFGSGNGNGNGGTATRRPPMGGDGAAGWDEGANPFEVPQSVVKAPQSGVQPSSAPTAANVANRPAVGDSLQSGPRDYSDRMTPTMRPPTPPANHWSVRRLA